MATRLDTTTGLPASSPGRRFDLLGMALSALCLVHCLLPLIVALIPFLSVSTLPAWANDAEWLHRLLLVPVILVSGPVLLGAGSRRPMIAVAGLVGLGLLASTLFVESESLELPLTAAGTIILLGAHWANLRSRVA